MNYSLYNVEYWINSTSYYKNDICYLTGVLNNIDYFYSLENNNLANSPYTSNKWTNQFVWTPSYSSDINWEFLSQDTTINVSQRKAWPINNEIPILKLNFNNRSERETRAIAHFISTKRGINSFIYNDPILNTGLNFIANNLKIDFSYYNLYNISFEAKYTPL